MLHALLVASSLAATPDQPTVAAWTARTLRFGEVALGPGAVWVSPAPHVQVGTAPALDVVGLPNGRIRIAPLETKPVAIAIDGSYMASVLPGLSVAAIEAGAGISLHAGRLDLHGTGAVLAHDVRGTVAVGGATYEAAVRDDRLVAHGGLEVRATRGGSVVATGGFVPWGRASGAVVGGPVAVYAAGPLGRAPIPEESWWATIGWQQTAGPLTVRAAVGASPEPWVWLRDALSVQLRLGGRRAAHADGAVAEADEVEEI
jgi:hypothetical protein